MKSELKKKWSIQKFPKIVKEFSPRISTWLEENYIPSDEEVVSSYLFGQVHTGKTIRVAEMLCDWHFQQFLQRKKTDYSFTSLPDLILEIKGTYGDNSITEKDILKKYLDVSLLVLDDLGVGKWTDWNYAILFKIINYRYEWQKTTLYTSNFSVGKLAEVLQDERIPARIVRQCNIIEFTNPPYLD